MTSVGCEVITIMFPDQMSSGLQGLVIMSWSGCIWSTFAHTYIHRQINIMEYVSPPSNISIKPQCNIALGNRHNINNSKYESWSDVVTLPWCPTIPLLVCGRGEDSSRTGANMAAVQHQEPQEQIPWTDLAVRSERKRSLRERVVAANTLHFPVFGSM